jgi:hypothetical protein
MSEISKSFIDISVVPKRGQVAIVGEVEEFPAAVPRMSRFRNSNEIVTIEVGLERLVADPQAVQKLSRDVGIAASGQGSLENSASDTI